MSNRVRELQERIASALEGQVGAACYLVDEQTCWYKAMTCARQALDWTIAQAEEKIGLAERHLSKIEPARETNWRAKPYLRLPFRLQLTNTARWMMQAYRLRLMLVPEGVARVLLEAAPSSPVKLTVVQRRKLGLLGAQMELPLPCPSRTKLSVAQVEERARSKTVKKRLEAA